MSNCRALKKDVDLDKMSNRDKLLFFELFYNAGIALQHTHNIILKELEKYTHLNNKYKLPSMMTLGKEIITPLRKDSYYKEILSSKHISRLSINLMIQTLLTNYKVYLDKQYKLNNASNKQQKKLLANHNGSKKTYGKPRYKRDRYTTIPISNNSSQNGNSIRIHRKSIDMPFFKNIKTKQNNDNLSDKQIKIIHVKELVPEQKYQLVIIYEKEVVEKEVNENPTQIGIDLNMANDEIFCDSNNNIIKIPTKINNKLNLIDEEISLLDSLISQCDNNKSKEHRRLLYKRHKLFRKFNNILKDFYAKTINQIIHQSDIICIEDLNSRNMRYENQPKTRLTKNVNKKLSKVKFFQIKERFIQTAENLGKTLILVDARYTSKTCNCCGHINHDLGLEKTWTCPNCGININRDLNAAQNILDFGTLTKEHSIVRELNIPVKKTIKVI